MNIATHIECSECLRPLVVSATRGTPTMPVYDATDGSECPSGVGHLPQQAPTGWIATEFCRWCQSEIRWSASYDIPHYVHTTAAAILACPGLATGQDVTPA